MPQSIDANLRDYLQMRIAKWIADEGSNGAELAQKAGVSKAQISDAINKGSIGWKTMVGLSKVFGMTLADLEREAGAWARSRPQDILKTPPGRKALRLRDRQEWADVSRAALAEHGELDQEDVDLVGRFPDEPDLGFGGPLDVPTVAEMAAVLRARRQRLLRKQR